MVRLKCCSSRGMSPTWTKGRQPRYARKALVERPNNPDQAADFDRRHENVVAFHRPAVHRRVPRRVQALERLPDRVSRPSDAVLIAPIFAKSGLVAGSRVAIRSESLAPVTA